MNEIARYYLPAKNPLGAYLPGVPLRDLTVAEFEALPPLLQRSVDAAGFYAAAKPPETPEEQANG